MLNNLCSKRLDYRTEFTIYKKTFFLETFFFLLTIQFFPSKPIFYLFWVGCLNCVFLLLHICPLYLRLPPNPRFITLRSFIFVYSSFFLIFLPLVEVILID
ncbi:hypothetical protein AMTRI_Chr07g23230 [Amborella trichopoda]